MFGRCTTIAKTLNADAKNKQFLPQDNTNSEEVVLKLYYKIFFNETQIALNNFLLPGINATAPVFGMALAAKLKNPAVDWATTIVLNSVSRGKILSLTDLHGNGP